VSRLTPQRFEEISERLGYRFADRLLLVTALSHSSTQRKHGDYERLEFLGDRVLGLVIADHLFRANPNHREGDLSARHSALVRAETCAAAGDVIGLSDLIMVGASERAKGMAANRTLLSDVMEALIAAIYLDGGLEPARDLILRLWQPFLAAPQLAQKDAKTFLQEWALARGLPLPSYRIVSREGPEHEPVFVVTVEVKDREQASGSAKSKRAAEQAAAAAFLEREGIRQDDQRR
jgi:ribonuclease-3